MTTNVLPLTITVSRSPSRRAADKLREAWQRWRRRRQDAAAMEELLALDDHALRDIGASGELRALAESQQGTAYVRLTGLLR